MNKRNKGLTFGLTIAMALAIIATTVPIVLAAPSLVTYTISNHTIAPPQTTEIDVEFSEKVDYRIAIEKGAMTVYDWTGSATNPKAKAWAGTYETNGSVVPAGDYTVNVTGTNTTTGESVIDNTEIITVTRSPVVTDPTATPDTIAADGLETSRLNVTVTNTAIDTVTVNLSQIGGSPVQGMEHIGNNVYSTTTNASVGTLPGTYNLPVNATDILGYSNTSVSIPLTVAVPEPDLNVSSIEINPGGTRGKGIIRVYVNESNNISAVVWNNGTVDAGAFDVCFDADGVKIGCVEVASLAAGANTTVSIDWTPTCANYSVMPGFPAQSLPITINVSADCNCTDCPACPADGSKGKIAESDETNNKLSKFIPAIQQYVGYDVIGGVVNNGYKSKNFDCNTTEEPLTLFEYDTEIVGGGIVYNVSGEKISTFAPGDTSARIHHIELPDGATVKKARLYVYWYDKWGNYKTYPTGCLANLSVNFSGTEFMPDVKYNDQKGFGYYHSPKGTYAYDVTSKVTGSGDYTAIVENIDPANTTSLLGEMLYVVYEGAFGKKVQIWTLEGNDYLMAADDTHGNYNYCVSPEEATATVAFPGSIDVANVRSATLVTVVAQGRTTGMDMLFNGNVVKKDAWDSPTEAYPNSKVCMESVDVTANLISSSNNMGFLDNGTDGMQASNAILVVEYVEIPPSVSISTDKTTYYPGETMIVTLNLTNPMDTTQNVRFAWYFGIPAWSYWGSVIPPTLISLPAGCDYSIPIPIPVGNWGATGFGAVWFVELYDPVTFETISSDTAEWSYALPPPAVSVGAREGEITAANIAEEMSEEINKTFKIEVEEVVAGLPA